MSSSEHVASLRKGLAVLSWLAAAGDANTLSHVAAALNIPPATARRFLITLVELGYVEAVDRKFRIAAAALELGYGYFASTPMAQHVAAELQSLAGKTGHSCFAGVLSGHEIIIIARGEGRLLETSRIVGSRLPAASTSIGRVLLADYQDSDINTILQRKRLRALTPKTKTKISDVRNAIMSARHDGYAVVDSETTLGLCAIAVPVKDRNNNVFAAIDLVLAPEQKISDELIEAKLKILTNSSARLSKIARSKENLDFELDLKSS